MALASGLGLSPPYFWKVNIAYVRFILYAALLHCDHDKYSCFEGDMHTRCTKLISKKL